MLPLDAEKNLLTRKTAVSRTSGSVRRASGFVQIAITLIGLDREALTAAADVHPIQKSSVGSEVLL